MKRKAFLFLVFIIYIPGVAIAQNDNYENLLERWEEFRQSDDYDKDYRAGSFLRNLEETLTEGVTPPDSAGLLPGWESDTTEDEAISAYAAYISFERGPDHLYYCIHDHNRNEVIALSHELQKKFQKRQISLDLQTKKDDADRVILEIHAGKNRVLELPDIDTALLIEKLARTRGDQQTFEIADKLERRIKVLMEQPSLFENDFTGFSNLATVLSSDDGFKIVTWNVEDRSGDHHFFGVTGVKRDDEILVSVLDDQRDRIDAPETTRLDPSNWYGAVYYEMVPVKHRGDMYYTLLGFNGKDAYSKEKIVEVATLSPAGEIIFGASVFNMTGRTKHRLIFEYSNQANMMLQYDEPNDRIVMDHLAPMEPRFEGDRSYYGPDFSYDALEFDGGKWVLMEDVDVRNR
ncbi:MAG: hypothetical protein R6U46_12150 [Marinilabilia sp.]